MTNAVNLIDGLDGLACGVSTISSITTAGHRPAGQRGGCGRHDGSAGRGLYRLFALQPESRQDFHGRYRSNLPGLYLGAPYRYNGMFKLPHYYLLCGALSHPGSADLRRVFRCGPAAGQGAEPHDVRTEAIFTTGSSTWACPRSRRWRILYVISAILGLSAVVLTASAAGRAMIFLAAMAAAGLVAAKLFLHNDPKSGKEEKRPPEAEGPAGRGENSGTENEPEQSSAQGEEDRNG